MPFHRFLKRPGGPRRKEEAASCADLDKPDYHPALRVPKHREPSLGDARLDDAPAEVMGQRTSFRHLRLTEISRPSLADEKHLYGSLSAMEL